MILHKVCRLCPHSHLSRTVHILSPLLVCIKDISQATAVHMAVLSSSRPLQQQISWKGHSVGLVPWHGMTSIQGIGPGKGCQCRDISVFSLLVYYNDILQQDTKTRCITDTCPKLPRNKLCWEDFCSWYIPGC